MKRPCDGYRVVPACPGAAVWYYTYGDGTRLQLCSECIKHFYHPASVYDSDKIQPIDSKLSSML